MAWDCTCRLGRHFYLWRAHSFRGKAARRHPYSEEEFQLLFSNRNVRSSQFAVHDRALLAEKALTQNTRWIRHETYRK